MAGERLGLLHGVPITIRDLFDFKPGWPATFGGIRALRDFTVPIRCAFAKRVKDRGGALILGKTNSPVMGFRGICDNYLFGPSCNPFDTDRNTGSSSGGSAAAVADGLLPLAEGTDGGGSIRLPRHPRGRAGHHWPHRRRNRPSPTRRPADPDHPPGLPRPGQQRTSATMTERLFLRLQGDQGPGPETGTRTDNIRTLTVPTDLRRVVGQALI
jgi:hypothetical protein